MKNIKVGKDNEFNVRINIEIDDTKHDSSNYAPIDTKEMQEESMYDVDDLLMIDNDEEADIELKGGCSKK